MENIKSRYIVATALLAAMSLTVLFLAGYHKQDTKEIMLKGARKLKNLVYYEATIHNPDGDFLPDWIDDKILGKLKEIF